MKNFFLVLLVCFLLGGCQKLENTLENSTGKTVQPNDSNEDSNDIIDEHGDIKNIKEFEKFMKNIKRKEKDDIRIISYTTEGDPIIHELEFNGETITSTKDTTRDKYGAGIIVSTTCKSIRVTEREDRTDYTLAD